MRIVVPDLASNSYFPAVAAVKLDCFRDEGIDTEVELLFPVDDAYRALAAGEVDLVAGSAHSALAAFPGWQGVKLLAAQAQGMYWFLVLRSDLEAERGDLGALSGKKIGAAPWVDLGLRQLLVDAGVDTEREGIEIAPVPGAIGAGTNFGLTAAKALAEGRIDGFWANGMGAEVAIRSGAGSLLLDVRRGDGPAGCFDYTFASIAARSEWIDADAGRAAAVVRALRRAQVLLAEDPERATAVGAEIFSADILPLIAELIRRDVPYYDAAIGMKAISGMNRFARELGLLDRDPSYEDVVAVEMAPLWGDQE
jgi:ABC-type nitrate/sulfonate/bicarbonate transport system substrate-binding protein